MDLQHVLIYVVFLVSYLCEAHPHSEDVKIHMDEETHLYQHLLDDHHYIKELRPATASNDTVTVTVDVSVTAIHGLDENAEELKSAISLLTTWQDPRLTWNVSHHADIHTLTLPASKIWKPDLNLVHSQYGSFEHFEKEYVTIHHDGVVSWSTHARVRSYCPLNIAAFPFDTHICHLELTSNVYDGQQIHLKFLKEDDPIRFNDDSLTFNRNSQWSVSKKEIQGQILTVMHPESFEVVSVSVELYRKSSFYKCCVLGPAVVLAVLVPVVFLLPTDSTVKITLGGLIMVTLCLSMKTLVDIIGINRAAMPNIAIYYSVTVVLTAFSIIMSAVIICVSKQVTGKRTVPVWLSQIFLGRCGLRRWLCMEVFVPGDRHSTFSAMKQAENEFTETDSDVTALKEGQEGERESKEIPKSVRVLVGKYQAETESRGHGAEWMEIARVIDRLLFILFLSLFLLTTLALLS